MNANDYFQSHGIKEETVKKFGLMWDEKKITIPIRNKNGATLFFKYRHLDFDKNKEGSIKFSYEKGGKATLFNEEALEGHNYVFIVEGEFDCMRLDQEGIAAVSNTSGAMTFNPDWASYFEGKKVYIVYDNDKAGEEGAKKVLEVVKGAMVLTLPKGYKDVCEYMLDHTKSDFRGLVRDKENENKITYKQLCDIFNKWLLMPDTNVLRILLATLVSHHFSTDPLWMFFVAPPSGSKTEIISSIAELPFCHLLSDLTPQTLASGMPIKNKMDPSLLSQLKNHVLIMKDFTTVLSMRQEDKASILAQLREVYDGKYKKSFGTGKTVDWTGRVTLIAGVTTIIDTQSSIFQVMGERFIMYRIPQSNDLKVSRRALSNSGEEKIMREELRDAMNKFFNSIKIPKVQTVFMPENIIDALSSLASFIARARTPTIRDTYKKELTYIPEPEAPARIAKQLGTLIRALAVIDGRSKVNWDDYFMTLRVGLDIIPSNRMRHLLALCGQATLISTGDIIKETEYSRSGAELILEDLVAMKLIMANRQGGGATYEWGISQRTNDYLKEMLPKQKEDKLEMDKYFPKNSYYSPLIKQMETGGVVDLKSGKDQIDVLLDHPIL